MNLVTFLGLHRRLRGALVGHLAAFEMTSIGPMARYARTLRRLGRGGHEFYDVHVEADAHHEVVAAHDLAQGLALDEPELVDDILFGALAVTNAERRLADHLLETWADGRTSLLRPLRATGRRRRRLTGRADQNRTVPGGVTAQAPGPLGQAEERPDELGPGHVGGRPRRWGWRRSRRTGRSPGPRPRPSRGAGRPRPSSPTAA